MSEDELELLQVQARKLTALDLKKQALAAKQSERVEEALEFLKQAKKIEQEEDSNDDDDDDDDEPPFSSTLPIFWKKVAVLCKQAGDLDRAKQALMHSKALELGLQTETEENEIPTPEPTPTPTPPPSKPDPRDLPPPSYDNIGQYTPPPPPSYDNVVSKEKGQETAVDEEEAAMLAELAGGGSGKSQERSSTTAASPSPAKAIAVVDRNNNNNNDDDDDLAGTLTSRGNTSTSMTFTNEELMDEEMMTEFRLGEVEGIPTQDEYAAKVLAYKKLALKCKQEGDIPKATQNLRAAKQLEKVALALKTMNDGLGLEINNGNKSNEDSLVGGGMAMPLMNAEESQLLGELFEQSSSPTGNEADSINGGNGAPKGDRLTVEDLEDMDDDNDVIELVDMMGADALPTVEELTEKITEYKQDALRYKQEGNIELAKTNLLQSKKAKLQAMRLAEIYRKLEMRKSKGVDDNNDDGDNAVGENDQQPASMEELEALMNGSETPKNSPPAAPRQPPPAAPKDPWLLKPSSEIKAEVIRLKNEKQVKEATRMLQLFKQKLAQEQKQIELVKRSKMTDTIQKRIDVSETQRTLWQYYHWFGTESAVGCGQHKEWTKFGSDCRRAIRLINSEGSNSVQLGPRAQDAAKNSNDGSAVAKKLYMLEDNILSLVETCTNTNTTAPSDAVDGATESANYLAKNALEVAVMGIFDMDKNEKVQKIMSKQPKSKKAGYNCPDLRINAKLQLPIHLDDASKPVFMNFEPTNLSLSRRASSSALEFKYDFDPSSKSCRQQIGLPRKDPKQERILLRRMETKTIQLSVYYLHNQQKREEAAAKKEAAAAAKKKSWFFNRGGSEPEPSEDKVGEGDPKDIFVGKVTIDFKQLLSRGCIAGDFPIMVNSKAIGGFLRICLRTSPVLDPDRYEGVPLVTADGESSSPSIKTYKSGLSFTFKKKDGEENTSIEDIKESAYEDIKESAYEDIKESAYEDIKESAYEDIKESASC